MSTHSGKRVTRRVEPCIQTKAPGAFFMGRPHTQQAADQNVYVQGAASGARTRSRSDPTEYESLVLW